MDIFQSDLGLVQDIPKTIEGIRLNAVSPMMYATKINASPFHYRPINDLDDEEKSPVSSRDFEDTGNFLKRSSTSSSSLSSLCTTLSSNNIIKNSIETSTTKENNITTSKDDEILIPSATSSISSYTNENQRKTRKKWKKTEDLALMEMLLNYSYLLTFVEYFKPMKKFWIKISMVLKHHHGFERNARQCHDRFKVLYFKAMKVNERSLGANPDITNTLFLQTRNTFTFCNGNITLRSPPAPLTSVSDTSTPEPKNAFHHRVSHDHHIQRSQTALQSNASTSYSLDLPQPPLEIHQHSTHPTYQYIFNGLMNLQGQIDVLRSQLQASESKNHGLTNLVQQMLQLKSLPNTDNDIDEPN